MLREMLHMLREMSNLTNRRESLPFVVANPAGSATWKLVCICKNNKLNWAMSFALQLRHLPGSSVHYLPAIEIGRDARTVCISLKAGIRGEWLWTKQQVDWIIQSRQVHEMLTWNKICPTSRCHYDTDTASSTLCWRHLQFLVYTGEDQIYN